eukprot:scaffold98266_cov60-Phaeocystis_antarctica.AAC.1
MCIRWILESSKTGELVNDRGGWQLPLKLCGCVAPHRALALAALPCAARAVLRALVRHGHRQLRFHVYHAT